MPLNEGGCSRGTPDIVPQALIPEARWNNDAKACPMSAEALHGLEPCHELLVAGEDAWTMLAAVAGAFSHAPAQLLSMSGARFTDGDCTLRLHVSGIAPLEAGRIAEALADHPDVRLSRIEHIVWKAR
jgi:hypothetical protein